MQGEKKIFCEYIRQNERIMYAFALGLTKNEADAADIIQDSIFKAYCNFHTLKNKKKFKTWIMSIIHNTAMDFLKKRSNIISLEDIGEIEQAPPGNSEVEITVWEAVSRLKMPYREVIILFYYQDLTISQIAEISSVTESNVKQQLSRGRKMLAEQLHKEDFFE